MFNFLKTNQFLGKILILFIHFLCNKRKQEDGRKARVGYGARKVHCCLFGGQFSNMREITAL
jgi:hypothetical protein